MLIELHMLQNFAPSNLNRDDTGAPKDCEFGGFRSARISSQCLKRAIRTMIKEDKLILADDLAVRTRLLIEELAKRLAGDGKDKSEAEAVAKAALVAAGLKVVKNNETEFLLFLGAREIDSIAALCLKHWKALLDAGQKEAEENGATASRGGKGKTAQTPISEVGKEIKERLDGGRAADLALFGRMIANLPDKKVDGSCQVAHAISTNSVDIGFDFFTAVDDLNQADATGAGMLGTIEFNSACYYRYANVDVDQLIKNLHDDVVLAKRTLDAFLHASIMSIPTGKQHSMAAQNPPSLVFVVVRCAGSWSLANAFVTPVQPRVRGDLVDASAQALDSYWHKLTRMYGEEQIVGKWVCALNDDQDILLHLHDVRTINAESLIKNTLQAVRIEAMA